MRRLARFALAGASVTVLAGSMACNGILGTLDLDYGDSDAGFALDASTDATLAPSDDGGLGGDDGKADATLDGSPSRTADAALADAAGDAGEDAAPTAIGTCPFDGGCPCAGSTCFTTLGPFPSTFSSYLADADFLYIAEDQFGLHAIALATGIDRILYASSDPDSSIVAVGFAPGGLLFGDVGVQPATLSTIGKDGGGVATVVSDSMQFGNADVDAVTTNASRVFWTDMGVNLRSVLLDGGGPTSVAIDGNLGPLIADANNVYFVGPAAVERLSLGSGPVEQVSTGTGTPGDELVSDGTSLFWSGANHRNLYTAPIGFSADAGTMLVSDFVVGVVDGDDGYVYFDGSKGINRCLKPACAGGPVLLFATAQSSVSVAVKSGFLYFIGTDANGANVLDRLPLN